MACEHCHCCPSMYSFNPDIIDWINKECFDLIVFEGGEPLLYIEHIKQLVSSINTKSQYKFVTNGTLLTDEIVEWLNANNVNVLVSFDGVNSKRDTTVPIKWELVAKLKNAALVVCCYPGNMDFGAIAQQIDSIRKNYGINKNLPGALHQISFPHQTAYAPNSDITIDDVSAYVGQVQLQILCALELLANGVPFDKLWFLKNVVEKWLTPKHYEGFACFNENNLHVTLDGRFLLCPYDHSYVGDIYNGVDWGLVKSYEPTRCKTCQIKDVCKTTCVANITANECIIAKEMHAFLKKHVRINARITV